MASENRTEKATPKRRAEARRKGQIARSPDLNSAVALLGATGALALYAPRMLTGFEQVMQRGLAQSGDPALLERGGGGELASWALSSTFTLAAPVIMTALAAGVLASLAQNRPQLSLEGARPQFSRLNPLQGMKRLFSPTSAVEGVKMVAKTAVVAGFAAQAVWPNLQGMAALVGLPPAALGAKVASLLLGILLRACAGLLLIGVADYGFQRWRLERSLRMSKEEVKQEHRQSDLAPEVRGAIRRKQFAQARKRMMADVPTADVVVTNPTHYAVALRYDGSRPAPQVIAKGMDLVAAQIRRIAREHDVPVLENPPLARSLHREVELGQEIPESFFAAVAEVLAFVYRTSRRRRIAA